MKTTLKEIKRRKMNNPILIEGLPGIGFVGKLVAELLVEELKAEKVAEIYSPHFPHHVIMSKTGVVRIMKNELYHVKRRKHDLLILVGEAQPVDTVGQYEVNELIIDYLKKKGGRFVVTIGGYGTGVITHDPRVFGAATEPELVQEYSEYGIEFGKTKGPIIGAAGLLLAIAKMKGLKGLCLMGETHGGYVDAKAAKKVLGVLSRILKITVATDKLDKKAAENEKMLAQIERAAQEETPETGESGLSYIR